jgi:class 3 adenylate cyclase/tetratricopeptide (TPR) repeat protein
VAACASCGTDLPAGARFCPSCGAPTRAPGEERKLATIVFADLVDSTALADEQDPERTRALLERFYDAMAVEIVRAGGTVEKFAGDAVMAAFGVPVAQEDHPERALHAALAMRRRLHELFDGRLQLRVGVNSGDVVVGRARGGSSFVSGDVVNVCARLEARAEPSGILVGERTAVAARGAFEFGEPLVVEAKGKRDGIVCRPLLRGLSLMRPRGVGGMRRAFVGREAELALLEATYTRTVTQREPHVVTIVGEPGVGKTRLVRELWDWLAAAPDEPVRRTGRCLPYGHGITYWPLGEILKEELGLLESDAPELIRERLGESQILGLTLGLDGGGDLHPLAARERLHEAWLDFLTELASSRPAVLLVEDLHWAEEPLLDLVERIVRDATGPLLVLGTARPELLDRRPSWGGGRRNTSVVWLQPLEADVSGRLLDELLAADLPAPLRELLVERADGNPFFLEELLGALIDLGVLERTGDGWEVREQAGELAVPDSVHGVVAARIDLLAPPEKAALQAAAVIGRSFWPGAVRALISYDDPDFELLEERDFVRRRHGSSMAGEREYAIKHALTREVAYTMLPKARRARLHAAFAGWLEPLAAGRDELAAVVAHHYAEAVRPEDADIAWSGAEDELERLRRNAVAWLTRAAEIAIGRYDVDDGLAMLERALELEPAREEEAHVWGLMGRVHALRFEGEAFWTAMQRSLEVCADRATCADTYSRLAFETSIRSGMWPRRPDRALVDGWIERALATTDPETPARARALVAQASWRLEHGEQPAREAAELAERLGDADLLSYARMARSATAFRAGNYRDARMWAERRFELEPQLSDPDHLVDLREAAVPSAAALGRFDDALRHIDEHVELARALSPHHRLHGVSLLVEVDELVGDWGALMTLRGRVEQAVAENADTPCVRNARCLLVCALALVIHGDDAGSREMEQAADALGMEGHGSALFAPRLRLALVRGDLDRVAALLDDVGVFRMSSGVATDAARLDGLAALRDAERIEAIAPPLVGSGTYFEPFALRALAAVREDESLAGQALERFRALGLDWHAEQTSALLEGGRERSGPGTASTDR